MQQATAAALPGAATDVPPSSQCVRVGGLHREHASPRNVVLEGCGTGNRLIQRHAEPSCFGNRLMTRGNRRGQLFAEGIRNRVALIPTSAVGLCSTAGTPRKSWETVAPLTSGRGGV